MTHALEKLAQKAGSLLNQHGLKLITAESCTGGGLGYWLTHIAGSSAWYEGGFITYSNAAKMEYLGVRATTLARYGAVSEETVREMAQGALNYAHADFSIAITGIAGPDGGTSEKPLGTVWIGGANHQATFAELSNFSGDREAVRTQSIARALELIIANCATF